MPRHLIPDCCIFITYFAYILAPCIVSYFVSVGYVLMYYYTGSTADIYFSVSQVLYFLFVLLTCITQLVINFINLW